MPERVPSLDVVSKVLNIDEQTIAAMQERYFERAGDRSQFFQKRVRGLFVPVDALRATIIANNEVVAIQRSRDVESLDEEGMQKLAAHLKETLPPLEKGNVPTLPVQLEKAGSKRIVHAITIAGSPEIIERRALAKSEIAKALGVKAIPEHLWLDDEETTTKVWLATGSNKQAGLIADLNAMVEEEAGLLPQFTEFGPIEVRPNS